MAVNARGGPPNYFLELRASSGAPGDALLTPLSSEANQAAPKAASDQVLANRLALASLLQKLHQLPATSDEKGALWLPVPGTSVPVTKRVEVAAQIERLRRLIRAGGDGKAASPSKAAARAASAGSTFPLRHKLGSVMADDLRQILLGRPGQEAKPSADNQQVVITAPPDTLARAQTFITVTDWPDEVRNRATGEHLRDTVLHTARSFFHACALEDSAEAVAKLLSLHVLAELKGGPRTTQYENYQMGGVPDAAWEKSLRADWPGKQEAIQRFVREWNRHPVKRITQDAGVAMGFGVKHFCTVALEGAPKEFYQVTIEPARTAAGTSQSSFFFSSLPPWWKDAPGAANPPPPPPAPAPLIRREVKQANPGGKDLVMTFEELRRDERTSTATVKHVSGASVPSAMFIARGAYDIARSRGATYFINLKEWEAEGGTRMYLIGFAPDKDVDPKTYFDLKEPLPADKRLLFLSVALYERIFKDQP